MRRERAGAGSDVEDLETRPTYAYRNAVGGGGVDIEWRAFERFAFTAMSMLGVGAMHLF